MTEILKWLEQEGFAEYSELFKSNRIDFDILSDLTEDDLEKLKIPLGDIKRILKAIRVVQSQPGGDLTKDAKEKPVSVQEEESAQRRQLTFVFADLVGSTSISEHLDPEEYRSIIQKVHVVYTRVIEQYGGWISQYQGDGIFAYFGYPRANEDDAERAVAASLSIVSGIQDLNRELDVTLQVRVGIATGTVVVGDLVGDGIYEKNAAMGDTPNIGAKIQLYAKPDTVVINDVTKKLLGSQFVCEDKGLQHIEGMLEPVRIWWAKHQTLAATRFEARHNGTLSTYVGHEDEVELLQRRWLQCLKTNRNSTADGQVVLISGEPGIGKSRLTQELCECVQEDHTVLHYQCSSHHMDSALHPIIMQLAANAQFEADDSPDVKLKKLAALMSEANQLTSTVIPVLARLFEIASENDHLLEDKTPGQIKELTLETLLDYWVSLAGRKPLLIVFEDLQWIDPTSQELLDLLVSRIEDLESTVLATYRPEYLAHWVGQVNVTTLTLGRLNHNQSCALIDQQTEGRELPDQIVDMIIQKTDGVPLFLEELTKAVLESKSLVLHGESYLLQENLHQFILPITLQDSLMARLDRLPDARELAPIGATIGRTFSYSLLAAVTGLNEDTLRSGLSQLIDAQLLFEHGRIPESSYTFKHALVQDVAYESQLKSSRALVHEKIANTLVSEERRLGRSRPEVIALHYQRAGKLEKAFGFWIRAGSSGLEAGATVETVKLLDNASEYLAHYEETEANRPDRLQYFILLGKALNASLGAKSKDAENAFREAGILAEKMSDTDAHVHALDSEFGIIFNSGDTKRSIGPAQAMIQVGKERNHRVGTICGLQSMGMVMFTRGEFAKAREYLEEAIVDSEEHITGINSYPSLALMYLAWTWFILGDKVRGLQNCEASIESGRNEIPYSLAVSLGNSCYLYQFAHDLENLQRSANELVELAQSKGQLIWLSRGLFFQHWLKANRDKNVDELAPMENEVEKLLEAREEIEVTYYLGLVAETQLNLGRYVDANRSLDLAMELVEKNGETFYQAELLRIRGDLLRQMGEDNGDNSPATLYWQSLDVSREQSAKLWEEKTLARLTSPVQNRVGKNIEPNP